MAELKRALGFWAILSLSIGSIMGSTMFFGAAIGARHSGNASLLAWVIISLVGIYIAMCFGELVSMFPQAGGVYEYSKRTYGRFFSFIMGWNAWIVSNLSIAIMIVAAISYLLPDSANLTKIFVSVICILLLNLIALFGIEASAIVMMMFTFIVIAIASFIFFPGIFHVNLGNFSPFFSLGIPSVFVTIFFIAEGFFGWESTTYLAEETKEPEKIIPKALIAGTIIVGIMVISISFISLGIIPWESLASSQAPLGLVFVKLFGRFSDILNLGVVITMIGSAAASVVSLPRLILALARDKLFIAQFAEVHPKFKTPHKAIIFQTIICLIMFGIAFGRYTLLLSLYLPLAMLMYIFVLLCVFILRIREPEKERKFKVPFGSIGSILVVIFLASITIFWFMYDPDSAYIIKLGASFVLMGVPIYFLLTMYYNPDAIIKVNDFLAYISLLTEKIVLPEKLRNEIALLLGDIKNKKILEFGCSVGTLTLHLADKVKPKGVVYATELSINELRITRKRLEKQGDKHVYVIHDEHQINRVHPHVPKVDGIVSIGMMGYLQDVKKVLKEMNGLLPEHGKLVFVDYVDYFKVIPNVAWLSNEAEIKRIFRECGFSVNVTKKKGLLWNYLFVYGMKSQEDVPFI